MQPQNNFPAIAAPPFGPTSYGLTIFQPDAVLTAAQLNEWFSFVMAQEQATRTRLLGVGVATGLRPSLAPDGSTITVSAGCGLTSEGHLLRLEKAVTYAGYAAYAAPETYPALAGLKLLELRPAGEGGLPLTNFKLDQYAVVMFQNSAMLPAERCLGLNCNDNGATYDTKLRVLLVKQGDATGKLLKAGAVQAATVYSQLPPLALRRPVFTDATYLTRFQALKDFLQQAADAFGNALLKAATLVQNIDGFQQKTVEAQEMAVAAESFTAAKAFAVEAIASASLLDALETKALGSSSLSKRVSGRLTYVDQWRQLLISRVTTLTSDANAQYVYDWLKDLYDAYEEFRQATAVPAWLGVAMPAADAFPYHLVLGELAAPAAGLTGPQYRHAWQPAPSSSAQPDAPARGLWLFKRLGSLITQFSVPALASSGGTSGGISAADQIRKQDLIDRLEQEQLDILVKEQTEAAGNSALAAGAESEAETPRYSLVQNVPTRDELLRPLYEFPAEPVVTSPTGVPALRLVPDRARPAGFDQRSLPFYYAPAMRAGWSYARTTSAQTSLILSYSTAADAPLHVSQPLDYQLEGYDFYRVEGLLDAPAAAVLVRLLSLRQQYNLPFDVVAVCADPPGASQPLLAPLNEQYFADQEVEFDDLLLQLPADKPFSGRLRMTTTAFKVVADAYKAADPASTPRVDLLLALNAAYQSRLASLSTQLSFGPFAQANPGLEHGAGVPRGGTLVIVYRTPARLSNDTSTVVPLVVGDYYLPYRQGGRGPVVQFVLPTPPPTLAIAYNPVSTLDEAVPLSVTPAGGTFNGYVREVGGTYYFLPNHRDLAIPTNQAQGTHELIYTVGTLPPARLNVVLFKAPAVNTLSASVDAQGLATFTYTASNATQLVMDFGDGTSETFVLPVTPSQNGKGLYLSEFDNTFHVFTHKYTNTLTRYPTLTAVHGTHSDSKQITVSFESVVVRLEGAKVVVQNSKGTLVGTPASGGAYSTKSPFLVNFDNGKPLSSSVYKATKAGWHEAFYTVPRTAPASFSLFAVPNDFVPEGFEFDVEHEQIDGAVTLPTPPAGIRYEWVFEGQPLDDSEVYSAEGGPDTIFKFSIQKAAYAKPAEVPPLRLRVYDERSSIILAQTQSAGAMLARNESLVAQGESLAAQGEVFVPQRNNILVEVDRLLFAVEGEVIIGNNPR